MFAINATSPLLLLLLLAAAALVVAVVAVIESPLRGTLPPRTDGGVLGPCRPSASSAADAGGSFSVHRKDKLR